jgi:hypothetical protein
MRRRDFNAAAAPYVDTKAMRRQGRRSLLCVSVCCFVLLLPICTQLQVWADEVSVTSATSGRLPGPTATVARKQNWYCRRIERAIAELTEAMRSAKARAEREEEQMSPTLARMFARVSGPPGAGNAAVAEFQELRSDADQLNELLTDKGCTRYTIDVEPPAFLPR